MTDFRLTPWCEKTGCALAMPDGQVYWGDMHCAWPGTFVFNAAIAGPSSNPRPMGDWHPELPTYMLASEATFFERRGVFVLWSQDLAMNPALRKCLGFEGEV